MTAIPLWLQFAALTLACITLCACLLVTCISLIEYRRERKDRAARETGVMTLRVPPSVRTQQDQFAKDVRTVLKPKGPAA